MPLVIGAGPSVDDYDKLHLSNLARCAFTFGVNHAAFDFPCDVVVAMDYTFLRDNKEQLKEMDKPIVTREWSGNESLGLDLIELPNKMGIKYKFSGMVAAKLSDALSLHGSKRKSYIIGIDGGIGRYKGHKGVGPSDYTNAIVGDYEALGLRNTINLGMRSRISCWPKYSKLPKISKIIVDHVVKTLSIAWIRSNAAKVL